MIEDNAHRILQIYKHFKTKPGEALISNHFLGIGELRLWPAADLQNGIEDARRNGWVEKAERGWRLTEAGFEEAVRDQ